MALDELGAACSTMRMAAVVEMDDETVLRAVLKAEDAHLRARALTLRLGMRPHADASLLEKAKAAAASMHTAIRGIADANVRRQAAARAAGQPITMPVPAERVEECISTGFELTEEYRAQARLAIGTLLADETGSRGAN